MAEMSTYQVHIRTQIWPDEKPRDLQAAGDRAMSALSGISAIVATEDDEWSVTASIEAWSARDAVDSISRMLVGPAHRAGLPSWPVTEISAVLQFKGEDHDG